MFASPGVLVLLPSDIIRNSSVRCYKFLDHFTRVTFARYRISVRSCMLVVELVFIANFSKYKTMFRFKQDLRLCVGTGPPSYHVALVNSTNQCLLYCTHLGAGTVSMILTDLQFVVSHNQIDTSRLFSCSPVEHCYCWENEV